jgi:hypothetical protein
MNSTSHSLQLVTAVALTVVACATNGSEGASSSGVSSGQSSSSSGGSSGSSTSSGSTSSGQTTSGGPSSGASRDARAVDAVAPTASCRAAPVVLACTQTLSPGANLTQALSSAAPDAVLCLNAGTYGGIELSDITKARDVTLRSAAGNGTAKIGYIRLWNSTHFRFQNLSIAGMGIFDSLAVNGDNPSKKTGNIALQGNVFTDQVEFRCSGTDLLVDRSSFDNISACTDCAEGRLQLSEGAVVVTNNHFGGPGESDGIQVNASGATIGPGNVFDGIVQGNYNRHVDAIQLYGQARTTIVGNLFKNNDVQIMAPDGGDTETIADNVFVGTDNYRPNIQFGSHKNSLFAHNTLFNVTMGYSRKKERPDNSTNDTVRDNVFVDSDITTAISDTPGSGCSNCTTSNNLFEKAADATGVNAMTGPRRLWVDRSPPPGRATSWPQPHSGEIALPMVRTWDRASSVLRADAAFGQVTVH